MTARDVWLFAAFTFLIVGTLWHVTGHGGVAFYWYVIAGTQWIAAVVAESRRR